MRDRGLAIFLNYDWITDKRLLLWAVSNEEIGFYDGEQGVTIFVCDKEGKPV